MGDVRGKGFLIGIELVKDKRTREPFPPGLGVGRRVVRAAMERNFLCRASGDVITLFPALVAGPQEVQAMVNETKLAIDEVLRDLDR